jgi:hypothetical protein
MARAFARANSFSEFFGAAPHIGWIQELVRVFCDFAGMSVSLTLHRRQGIWERALSHEIPVTYMLLLG